ncbi:MAG: Carbon monoxide dehydrogenase medium chain [Syntrophorhabdus sp. PtaU1.Bin050]|jgi:CO/xanthine dehydrogenase FAD-binding subunit|nr:MAG: Carbon monoxide dehydrogenase medium chain [Syntrophorhabdus sp. PtaU1.Bin050]
MGVFYRRLPHFDYMHPKTLEEALKILNKYKEKAEVLAGGTDLVPQIKKREVKAPEYVIDLKGIRGLDKITYGRDGLRIGALVTINTIVESPVIREHYPILAQAAASMASPQVRNRGTFVGNICNAVPSADSAPALLALGASVKIKNTRAERTVPLESFFTGPRKTVVKPDELVLEITVPKPATGLQGVYLKLSPRHSMDLAVVGVAAAGSCEKGVCKDVRIALGAVAPTPIRASKAERILKGKPVTPELIMEAAKKAATECSPIDDHRASKEYRCDMVHVLTKRALTRVLLLQEG